MLRSAAFDAGRKASSDSFARERGAQEFIEQSYLSRGVIDLVDERSARKLIAIKAKRIYERSGGHRPDIDNWLDAERYVRGFYEHIIPAVKERRPANIEAIAEALCSTHRPEQHCDIVNCFEAALVIYYVDAKCLEDACGPAAALLF